MPDRPDDICPRIESLPPQTTRPAAAPIYPASVYACDSTDQAEALLEGTLPGYVYQRNGHPNADLFAAKCRELHGAQQVAVAASGMAAMAVAVVSQLECGDHLVVSNQLYGRSLQLLTQELARLGIQSTVVDTSDVETTAAVFTGQTKLLVVETIGNPLLRVADIAALTQICRARNAKLLVDNTFATPVFCRPLARGADIVLESVSKMMNGHSDVMLGVLCGHDRDWQRVPLVLTAWGLASSPWDCWLSARGLATMHLRVRRAAENALKIAQWLTTRREIGRVDYPGLSTHPDHELAVRQFDGGFGTVVTFHLRGGRSMADVFIQASPIPFCPSLGEVCTTLSHPESTSHRGLSASQRSALGITGGTIRLSLGIESADYICQALAQGFSQLS